jgi:peptidyl-prolyl cis-trans isomerase D
MFDFIRKHTRVLFFFLIVLIIPSFVFFGLDGYTSFREQGNAVVADVAGIQIKQAELDAAHREQIERVRREQPTIDVKMLDTPALKAETLDSLIRDRLLLVASDKLHLVTTDDRLARLFRQDPQLAFLRKPDGSLNKEVLQAQGLSPEGFEQRLRQDISSRQVTQGVEGSVLAPAAAASAGLDAFFQQREVQVERFDPVKYMDQVKPTDADLEKFHKDPAHAAQFQAPEQASIEYVVLDVDSLKKDIALAEDDLKKYYTENEARYTAPEERRASHILIKAEASASADVKAKAKAKAEALLAEARKNPAGFADLARKNSDDPGSAQNGGDLDFFGRGAMVKPFEDAAFALEPGAISDVVTSDFGYHVIQVTGARGGEKRSFEAVRPEIEEQVRKQLAQKKFSEFATEFSNMVYEQADALKPVAERFKLELRTAKGLTRTPPTGVTGPLASPKLLEAVFGNDAVRNKRNTDAVETAPNQLVSARIVQYQPARSLPLDAVRDQVKAQVTSEQAAALARKDGEARLAALKADAAATLPNPPVTLSRVKPGELPRQVVDAALRAPASPLPAWVGVDLGNQGYAIVKLSKVLGRDPAGGDDARNRASFAQALAEAESLAYYNALKVRFKVERKAAAPSAAASAASK